MLLPLSWHDLTSSAQPCDKFICHWVVHTVLAHNHPTQPGTSYQQLDLPSCASWQTAWWRTSLGSHRTCTKIPLLVTVQSIQPASRWLGASHVDSNSSSRLEDETQFPASALPPHVQNRTGQSTSSLVSINQQVTYIWCSEHHVYWRF